MNDRDKRLADFLTEVAAKIVWSHNEKNSSINCYAVDGKPFIVQRFANEGWEIYIPAHPSNTVELTLSAVRRYLA